MAWTVGGGWCADNDLRHVVWDWNGPLFDDHAAVVAAVNDALARLAIHPIDAEAYRSHYTRPVQVFYERLAGRSIESHEWQVLDDAYHASYRRGLDRLRAP